MLLLLPFLCDHVVLQDHLERVVSISSEPQRLENYTQDHVVPVRLGPSGKVTTVRSIEAMKLEMFPYRITIVVLIQA